MKCPDCAGELSKISVVGTDDSYRCGSCGGFWVMGWVVNRVAEGGVKKGLVPLKSGRRESLTRNCPTDQTALFKPEGGEAFPPGAAVFKCPHCSWWWVGGDDLFSVDEAYKARRTFFRLWQRKPDWATWALPVVAVVVLIAGLAGGVNLVRYQTRVGVGAGAGVRQFTAVYVGQGEARGSFKSGEEIKGVEYQQAGETDWAVAETTVEKGVYTARLMGLSEGEEYTVRVEGKEYRFTAK